MAAMGISINLPRSGRRRMRADRSYEGRSIVMLRQSLVGCQEVAQIYTQPNPRAWDARQQEQGVWLRRPSANPSRTRSCGRGASTSLRRLAPWHTGMVAAQGCVAQATGCQLEASSALLGRPGLRIFDVRFVRQRSSMYSFDTKSAMHASSLASISSCHIANNNHTKHHRHHRHFYTWS